MKEEMLKDLIEKTFATVASPLHSNGIYAAIQKAVIMAYDLGKKKENARTEELLQYNTAQ